MILRIPIGRTLLPYFNNGARRLGGESDVVHGESINMEGLF